MNVKAKKVGLGVAAGLFLLDQIRVLVGAGIRFTNEDQTIFWYVARDYLHLRPSEPLFYGSPYASHLEALVAAPLIAVRVPLQYALPVATMLLTAAPWVLFARAAWRQGLPRVAICILITPLLLPVEYLGIGTQAGHNTGAALGGIAASLVLQPEAKGWAFGVFAFLSALLVVPYVNIIFIAAPAALVLVLAHYRERPFWAWAGGGACLGGAAAWLALHFYATHPSFVLHPQWPLAFSWGDLADGVRHLDRHLGDVTPIGLTSSGFLVLGTFLLVWLSFRTRRWQPGLAGIVAVAGILISLGIPKTHDGSASITFAYARMYIAVPLLLPFLAIAFADVAPSIQTRAADLALAVALMCLVGWREATLGPEIDRMMGVPSPVVGVVPTEDVLKACDALRELARTQGAELVVYRESRVNAYACGASWYGSLETLYPPYDRRTRRLFEERDRVRQSILVADADPQLCARMISQGLTCEWVDPKLRAAIVRSPGISAITLASQLGIAVRQF
jgi:hypothetical protein